jgi:hypothetical protein
MSALGVDSMPGLDAGAMPPASLFPAGFAPPDTLFKNPFI